MNAGAGTLRGATRGTILFVPSETRLRQSRLTEYAGFLGQTRGLYFGSYTELHAWSVEQLAEFWSSLAEFFGVHFTRRGTVPLDSRRLPGAHWFPGYELNYAEHALLGHQGVALIYRDEAGHRRELSFDDLRETVARCRVGLMALGVRAGDRVVGYVANCPEAVIAFLASASLGAIWSSCPPEFGAEAVLERFEQIAPKVLICTDADGYGGRRFDRARQIEAISHRLPTLVATVVVSRGGTASGTLTWDALLAELQPLAFTPAGFEHPLWILYSSGTTGKPKPIVHGHGGIVLEHLKALALHGDLRGGERFFWYSTTGWMMWNYLISGLLLGTTVVLYEGSPVYPTPDALWALAAEERLDYFGTSAPYVMACRARGLEPGHTFDLSSLRVVGSTGAALPREGFEWVYAQVGGRVHLASISGGTDVCSAFVLSCPWLPVRSGELQCAALGAAVEAFDEHGKRVFDQVGELVLTRPMPSMPLRFWNDPEGKRFHESYFARFDGVWCHGDWIRQFPDGGAVIYGRSDATLNRGGVRMGTSEFYRVVESIPGVADSLVVDTGSLSQAGRLWLFLVVDAEIATARRGALFERVHLELRERLSPRHVPDVVCAVPAVPYTLSGKKLEVPVKQALSGEGGGVQSGTLRNPEALDTLLRIAREHLKNEARD